MVTRGKEAQPFEWLGLDARRDNKMDESDRKKFLTATLVSLAAAMVVGTLLGLAAGAWGVGLGWMALPVGLAAGVPLRLFGVHHHRVTFLVALLCMGTGMAVHTGAYRLAKPGWTAKQKVHSRELDGQAKRILALQMCCERKIMGVWDYDGVPQEIKDQADERVAEMSEDEKLALCDETFAQRINTPADRGGRDNGFLALAGWVVLTGVLAIAPLALKNRYE